jgi:hypothetical protein
VVADFLGDFRPDFWVSDRYGGQMGWAAVNNQVFSIRRIEVKHFQAARVSNFRHSRVRSSLRDQLFGSPMMESEG